MTAKQKTAIPSEIIQNLHAFNRKERDRLMKFALCRGEYPQHRISVELWKLVRPSNGRLQRPKPEHMFLGMDYHLNWLYAALVAPTCDDHELKNGIQNDWKFTNNRRKDKPIQGNQQDVDLLVAWHDGKRSALNLTLIEAKLDSGWLENQFAAKLDRIKKIVLEAEHFGIPLECSLLLLSPTKPPESKTFGRLPRRESNVLIRHETLPTHKTQKVTRDSSEGKLWKLV